LARWLYIVFAARNVEEEVASMNKSPFSCYSPRFIAFALVWAAVVVGAAFVATKYPRGSAIRLVLAAVQGIATGAIIVSSMLSLRRLDEMQQRVQLEALAMAFAGTGVLATAYGFLVNAGLPNIDWGAVTWPAMVGLWAIGLAIANRRYR
jgi:MFS family permease